MHIVRTSDSMVLLIGFCDKKKKSFFSCTSRSLAQIHWLQASYAQLEPLCSSPTGAILLAKPAGCCLEKDALGLGPQFKKSPMRVTFRALSKGLIVEELLVLSFAELQAHKQRSSRYPRWAGAPRIVLGGWNGTAQKSLKVIGRKKTHTLKLSISSLIPGQISLSLEPLQPPRRVTQCKELPNPKGGQQHRWCTGTRGAPLTPEAEESYTIKSTGAIFWVIILSPARRQDLTILALIMKRVLVSCE